MVKKKTTKKTKAKTGSRKKAPVRKTRKSISKKSANRQKKTTSSSASRHKPNRKTATDKSRTKPGPDPIELPDDAGRQLEAMAGMGLTIAQMAAIMGMGKATLERRLKDNDELKIRLEKGRAKALLSVSRTAYDMAVSGKVPAMTMFYLKCRGGWKETQKLEHSGSVKMTGDGLAVGDVDRMSDEEVMDELRRFENEVQTGTDPDDNGTGA